MSISVGTESLQVCLGNKHHDMLAGFTAREQSWRNPRRTGDKKSVLSWNLPKLSKLRWCNGGFGPSTTQKHLRTKQFVSGTRNSSRVAACALWNEQVGRGHRPRLASVCEKLVSECARRLTEASAIPGSRDVLTYEGSWQKLCINLYFRRPTETLWQGYTYLCIKCDVRMRVCFTVTQIIIAS
jgi:hypothetical protein